LPAGIPSTVQHTVNAAMTSGPYFNGRTLLTVTILCRRRMKTDPVSTGGF
jgi:hypothetical protein